MVRPSRETRKKVLLVAGTRPEVIKVAPVLLALQSDDRFEPRIVVTGQHREMLDDSLAAFNIQPDHDLGIFQHGHSLTEVLARAVTGLADVLGREAPDMVMVQGDTTSTLAGAIAAFHHRVAVGHIEAGLRTGNADSPYPEEVNRRLVSQVARIHFAPTVSAGDNLVLEGVPRDAIHITGNTAVDALRLVLEAPSPTLNPALTDLIDDHRRLVLITTHRRESWGRALEAIADAVATCADDHDDCLFAFTVHGNPALRTAIASRMAKRENIVLLEPVGYASFARLMSRSDLIITDSGGIQEEAPSLGLFVLVVRETTERPEAVAAGFARVVGTATNEIVDAFNEWKAGRNRPSSTSNPFGDGKSAVRIVAAMAHFFGLGPPPRDFVAS